MKNGTDYFLSLVSRSPDASFHLNTNIFLINLINLSVVLGVLILFIKESFSEFLKNRKNRIVKTIEISEELYSGASEKLKKARDLLCEVEMEATQFRATGYSTIEHNNVNLINSTSNTLEKLEKLKKENCLFEQQRAIKQVQQWVLQQTLRRVVESLNIFLNNELHRHTINVNINML